LLQLDHHSEFGFGRQVRIAANALMRFAMFMPWKNCTNITQGPSLDFAKRA